jgi:fatty-acyl-CoA synthase
VGRTSACRDRAASRQDREGATATAEELRAFLAPDFAKWWLPDRFEFVEEIPKTSVGKFRKTALREQFAQAPAAAPAALE